MGSIRRGGLLVFLLVWWTYATAASASLEEALSGSPSRASTAHTDEVAPSSSPQPRFVSSRFLPGRFAMHTGTEKHATHKLANILARLLPLNLGLSKTEEPPEPKNTHKHSVRTHRLASASRLSTDGSGRAHAHVREEQPEGESDEQDSTAQFSPFRLAAAVAASAAPAFNSADTASSPSSPSALAAVTPAAATPSEVDTPALMPDSAAATQADAALRSHDDDGSLEAKESAAGAALLEVAESVKGNDATATDGAASATTKDGAAPAATEEEDEGLTPWERRRLDVLRDAADEPLILKFFWAPSCSICRHEIDVIKRVLTYYPGKNIMAGFLNMDVFQAHAQALGIMYPGTLMAFAGNVYLDRLIGIQPVDPIEQLRTFIDNVMVLQRNLATHPRETMRMVHELEPPHTPATLRYQAYKGPLVDPSMSPFHG